MSATKLHKWGNGGWYKFAVVNERLRFETFAVHIIDDYELEFIWGYEMSKWTDPKLDQLATQFFREFSRMEYALKATHYLGTQGRRDAKADWVKFGEKINDPLMNSNDENIKKAVKYMLNSPPKKQVVNSLGNLEWEDTPPTASCQAGRVLLCVCRVRNNLFGVVIDVEKFIQLRAHCLIFSSWRVHAPHVPDAETTMVEAKRPIFGGC